MSGYIGATPVPQATQHRQAFTATAAQTSFATAGYTPQFVDVYLNGVKLAAADYTATNGSDIVLTTGAAASDILEYVAYTPFEVADQTFTGTTTLDVLSVTGAATGTDLTLSGGVYLGGVAAANKLDFYEEGIFTPTCTAFSAVVANGYYRLINDTCFVWLQMSNVSGLSGVAVQISLPFTSAADQGIGLAGTAIANRNNAGIVGAYVGNSASVATFLNTTTTDSALLQFSGANIFGASAASFAIYVSLKYRIA